MGLSWQKYTEELLVAVSHIQDSNNGEEMAKPETCVTAKNNDGYLVFNISDFFFLNGTRKSPFLCRTRKSLTTARNTVHCLSSEILKQWGRIKPVTTENTHKKPTRTRRHEWLNNKSALTFSLQKNLKALSYFKPSESPSFLAKCNGSQSIFPCW